VTLTFLPGEAGTSDNEQNYSNETPPIVQWGGAPAPFVGDRAPLDDTFIGSLLIDLRTLNMNDDVVVELYAGLEDSLDDDLVFTVGAQTGYYVIQRASTPDDLAI